MFYMHGGKIYAPRNDNGALIYDAMQVQIGNDGAPYIVNDGGSVEALPLGCVPMTQREVLARIPASEPKPKRTRKAAKADVSEI